MKKFLIVAALLIGFSVSAQHQATNVKATKSVKADGNKKAKKTTYLGNWEVLHKDKYHQIYIITTVIDCGDGYEKKVKTQYYEVRHAYGVSVTSKVVYDSGTYRKR